MPYFPPLQSGADFTPQRCAEIVRQVAKRPDLELEVGAVDALRCLALLWLDGSALCEVAKRSEVGAELEQQCGKCCICTVLEGVATARHAPGGAAARPSQYYIVGQFALEIWRWRALLVLTTHASTRPIVWLGRSAVCSHRAVACLDGWLQVHTVRPWTMAGRVAHTYQQASDLRHRRCELHWFHLG